MVGQLDSLQKHIEAASVAFRVGDNVKTLEEVNAVDSGLFNITRSLDAQG